MFASQRARSGGPPLRLGALQLEPVAGPRPVGDERAVDRLEHAVEEHRLDADVVVEVLEVAQPVDAAERVRGELRRAVPGQIEPVRDRRARSRAAGR